MHVTPSGPTVAECAVPAGRSSRSPGPSVKSRSSVWNVIEPATQKSTLWWACWCTSYLTPGPFDQACGTRPSAANPVAATVRAAPARRVDSRCGES